MKAIFVRLVPTVMLLVLVFAGASSERAYACSCGQDPTLPRGVRPTADYEAQHFDAVFLGRVLGGGAAPNGSTSEEWASAQYLFAVDEAWKGVDANQVYVYSGSPEPGACGYPFETGQSYLVYAGKSKSGKLYTVICAGTKSLDYAGQDVGELGPGNRPTVSVNLPAPAGAGIDPSTWVGPVLSVSALGVIIVLVGRVKRLWREGKTFD